MQRRADGDGLVFTATGNEIIGVVFKGGFGERLQIVEIVFDIAPDIASEDDVAVKQETQIDDGLCEVVQVFVPERVRPLVAAFEQGEKFRQIAVGQRGEHRCSAIRIDTAARAAIARAAARLDGDMAHLAAADIFADIGLTVDIDRTADRPSS